MSVLGGVYVWIFMQLVRFVWFGDIWGFQSFNVWKIQKHVNIFFHERSALFLGLFGDIYRYGPAGTRGDRVRFELLRFVACRRPSHKEGGCMLHEVG